MLGRNGFDFLNPVDNVGWVLTVDERFCQQTCHRLVVLHPEFGLNAEVGFGQFHILVGEFAVAHFLNSRQQFFLGRFVGGIAALAVIVQWYTFDNQASLLFERQHSRTNRRNLAIKHQFVGNTSLIAV